MNAQDIDIPFKAAAELAESTGGFFHDMQNHFAAFIPRGRILVVSFDNLSSDREQECRMPWAEPLCIDNHWSSLGIMMKQKDWFRHPDVWDFFDKLRDEAFFKGFERVVFYGASMGGYGALAFSEAAPGATVLAFNPQTSLDPLVVEGETRWRPGYEIGDWTGRYCDGANAPLFADKTYVFYDPLHTQDRNQCERISGENVFLLPCWHMGHKLPPGFRKMHILKPLTSLAMRGELGKMAFFTLFRARFTSSPYLEQLIYVAMDKRHYKLALNAIDAILARKSQWRFRRHRRGLVHAIRTNTEYDWRSR